MVNGLKIKMNLYSVSEENLLYLMSRGISYERAVELIILGFIDKFKQELPVEYAVELNQLIKKNL